MRRLAWTFAARIGDKYQVRLTRPKWYRRFLNISPVDHVMNEEVRKRIQDAKCENSYVMETYPIDITLALWKQNCG